MTLPGWDSLDSVKSAGATVQVATLVCWSVLVLAEIVAHVWKRVATFFTWVALAAFFLAVCGEVITYKYNGRKDILYDLREQQIVDSSGKQIQKANDEAKSAKASATHNQKYLDALKEQAKWRQVSKEQRSLLLSKLSPFPGTTVTLVYMLSGGEETEHYANLIADALRNAKWTVGVNAGSNSGKPRYDLTMAVNDKVHPHAATVLLEALKEGNFPDPQGESNSTLSKDTIELIVRPKPPAKMAP